MSQEKVSMKPPEDWKRKKKKEKKGHEEMAGKR